MGSSGSGGGEISGHQGRTSKKEGKNCLSKFSTAKTHLCFLIRLLPFYLLTKLPQGALISGKAKFCSMSAPQSPLYLMYSQLHCTTSFFSSVMLNFSSPHLNISSIRFVFICDSYMPWPLEYKHYKARALFPPAIFFKVIGFQKIIMDVLLLYIVIMDVWIHD